MSAGVRFTFSLGPDIHREVVELRMAVTDQARRIATEFEEEFRDRGLVISMRSDYAGGFFRKFLH